MSVEGAVNRLDQMLSKEYHKGLQDANKIFIDCIDKRVGESMYKYIETMAPVNAEVHSRVVECSQRIIAEVLAGVCLGASHELIKLVEKKE